MHGPGGGPRGGHGSGPRGGHGPRGGFGPGPRGGYGYGPRGGYGPHGPGHHRPHHGFYGRRKNKNYVRRGPSDGSMWKEFKNTMSYSLKKYSIFGLATGLLSFVLIDPIQDISYTYRKNAYAYSKSC